MAFLSAEDLELLKKEMPEIANKEMLDLEDTKRALGILRAPLPGHQIRDMTGSTTKVEVSMNDFANLLLRARDANDTSSHFRKSAILKQADQVEAVEGLLQAKHTYSLAEERGFTNWINKNLTDDADAKASGAIPISFDQHELFSKVGNGIVLCKMVNLVQPNTIHQKTINTGDKLKHIWNVNTNLTLAINSAASIGCCVTNIGPADILEGRKHIILGLIWQLIRKCIVDTITLSKHVELATLLLPGETLDDLNKLKPEVLLLRWVNFQLERAGCPRRMSNFNEDIHDSEIYSNLLNQIAPEHLKGRLIKANETMPKSLEERARDVCSNAGVLDCGQLISPENIWEARDPKKRNDNLHLGFVATLFNTYPAMDPPQEIDLDAYKETLEEKTYRNWMNSMGVTPYVNHLYKGLQDGLVPLQLVDIIRPNTVEWKGVTRNFDPKKEIYQKPANCNLFVEAARKIGIKLVNISGQDIFQEQKKLVLGSSFSLMQTYLHTLLQKVAQEENVKCDEKDVLKWTNKMLAECEEESGSHIQLTGFKDRLLSNSKPICLVVNAIVPGICDLHLLTGDDFQNAVYALSCARKIGAKVYALPEHLVQMDAKMIMTVFLCLMIEYHTRCAIIKGNPEAAACAD